MNMPAESDPGRRKTSSVLREAAADIIKMPDVYHERMTRGVLVEETFNRSSIFLVTGSVEEALHLNDGRQVDRIRIGVHSAPQFFSGDFAPQSSLTAISPCDLIRFPPSVISLIAAQHPYVMQLFLSSVITRENFLQRRMFELLGLSAEERVALELERMAGDSGIARTTQQTLAEGVNATRVTVNRILSGLRRSGQVTIDQQGIHLRRPSKK